MERLLLQYNACDDIPYLSILDIHGLIFLPCCSAGTHNIYTHTHTHLSQCELWYEGVDKHFRCWPWHFSMSPHAGCRCDKWVEQMSGFFF